MLGVCGGIAAYKAVELCRRLVDAGFWVMPILTKGALKMVGEATFSALASEPARTELFGDASSPVPHIEMAQSGDLVLVAPATARVISDIRTARSGDLLTATVVASRAPLMICPAMHTEMWDNEAVRENISVLQGRGAIIVGPTSGALAGGDVGMGRLAEADEIVAAVKGVLGGRTMAGKQVLVTAGGTREPIDAVRYLGNRSSGKQGHAIAEVAARRGAQVCLVTTLPDRAPSGVRVVEVSTANEMHQACRREALQADLVVMAAAVADFRPKKVLDFKIDKAQPLSEISLEPTADVLAELGAKKPLGQVLVGFAADTSDIEARATKKLEAKNLDFIVANDVTKPGVGFEHDTNAVAIVSQQGEAQTIPLASKKVIAEAILDKAIDLLDDSDSAPPKQPSPNNMNLEKD